MVNPATSFQDDDGPKGLIPAVEFILFETRRHAFTEASHYLEVAVESLKDELADRKTKMN